MGFKKTEKGNVIYEFDFVPSKLVPIKPDECGGCLRRYAVIGANGERAPVAFELQASNHENYALVTGVVLPSAQDDIVSPYDVCICSNVPVVATFAKLVREWQASWDNGTQSYRFDPTDTNELANNGKSFQVMSLKEANIFYDKCGIPRCGYENAIRHMS